MEVQILSRMFWIKVNEYGQGCHILTLQTKSRYNEDIIEDLKNDDNTVKQQIAPQAFGGITVNPVVISAAA